MNIYIRSKSAQMNLNENLNPPAMLGRAEKVVMGIRIEKPPVQK